MAVMDHVEHLDSHIKGKEAWWKLTNPARGVIDPVDKINKAIKALTKLKQSIR